MRSSILKIFIWSMVGLLAIVALAIIATARGESINCLWVMTAGICVYVLGYRFYSAFIATKVLMVDSTRVTPAEHNNNGRDYMPTHKWLVFGHHFAAIAGPGPLIGPTLAAQFGYLPGVLWIVIGAVIGGCVQDFTTLFFSMRRNGRSLGQMAKEEISPVGGMVALFGVMMIIIILMAVLGLVVANAMKHSAWATSTVSFTIPIAILVGIYMRFLRPGRIVEATILGVSLLILAVFLGGWIDKHDSLSSWFDYDATTLAWCLIAYGFAAAALPVWLLLTPRDYLSSFIKIGTVIALAVALFMMHPNLQMPAITQFVDGTGPIFSGKWFPFVFITIACGAISGFHSLVASGTTPKMLCNEQDARMVGYGAMLVESFVALMAIIAATIMEPGVYFAINSPAAIVGKELTQAVATITSWGFPITVTQMQELASSLGEQTLLARVGGAPSFAIGIASVFSFAYKGLLAFWYHFAIMFEALFVLTTLDAGTRVARFMLQDLLGNIYAPLGRTSWYPSVILTSALVVISWGYFLYIGTIDPLGGINSLWPLFGIANQMLAAIALCVGTTILLKSGRLRYVWVTAIPLIWLVITTSSAALIKLFSAEPRLGFLAHAQEMSRKLANHLLPPDQVAHAPQLIFNDQINATLTALFLFISWVLIIEVLRIAWRVLVKRQKIPLNETIYVSKTLQQEISP